MRTETEGWLIETVNRVIERNYMKIAYLYLKYFHLCEVNYEELSVYVLYFYFDTLPIDLMHPIPIT